MNSLAETLQTRFDVAAVEVTVGPHRYQLLKPRNADELLDEDEFEHDDRIPYWADLWPSARVLAERLTSEHGRGRKLLELGCGVGLCSLAAAKAGFDVLASDYYDDALRFVTANAERNGIQHLATRMIDWRHLPDDLGQFEWIVAADVLYEKPYAELVAETIRKLLAPGGTAIVSDPGRKVAVDFPEYCELHDLTVVSKELVPYRQEGTDYTIEVFTLRG
jgi:predicted nicotinamide N-methyase